MPPNMILAFGTKLVLDELPLNATLVDGVSASSTVKGRMAVDVLGGSVWFAIALSTGAAGPLATVVIVSDQPPLKLPPSPGASS